MNTYLDQQQWTHVETLVADGSARRYSRVEKNGKRAVLMEVYGDTPGHRIEDFLRIGNWLRKIDLNAPEVYERGDDFLLIEDFGDITFKEALNGGQDPEDLYALATDVLQTLSQNECPLELPNYFDSHVHKGHRRVIDWFVPSQHKEKNPDDLAEEYLRVWRKIEQMLPACKQGFTHIDFHVQNLMWCPHREGIKRCGILDFQGAMKGPIAYDLGNLLEDARIDVAPELRTRILKNYDQDFLSWYRVLTTQFHCRIIGQFIKMALQTGKDEYLAYLPRVGCYIDEALKDPLLEPLNALFLDLKLDFKDIKSFNVAEIKPFIRTDAY